MAVIVLGLDDALSAEPIVSVDDIEPGALIGFGFAHEVGETVAHVVHFGDEVGMQVDGTAMVVDAVDDVVRPLAFTSANEVVNFVTAAPKSRG